MERGKRVAVLGAGAWGTAVATVLADNGVAVTLWCFEEDCAHDIKSVHINKKYLPDVILSNRIQVTTSLMDAVSDVDFIFEAIPVRFLRSVFSTIAQQCPQAKSSRWVILSKGIEQDTTEIPSTIIEDVFKTPITYAVVAGPNFAQELVQRVVTATIVASHDQTLAQELALILTNDYFKAYVSNDPLGVQVCGAVKNVIALIVGIAQGSGYKHENTVAFLVTKGLEEIAQLTSAYKGLPQTAFGLAGLGDVMLTCAGTLSRNLRFGKHIGGGMSLDEVSKKFVPLPEGVGTAQSIYGLVKQRGLSLPLCQAAYECVFEGLQFKDVIARL